MKLLPALADDPERPPPNPPPWLKVDVVAAAFADEPDISRTTLTVPA